MLLNYKLRSYIFKKYYSDWIRGYFDGDGSISLLSRGCLSGNFFSSSKDVLKFIVENIPGTDTITKEKNADGYRHLFGGDGTSRKIYNYLYKKNCVCLGRKKDKFLLKVKV